MRIAILLLLSLSLVLGCATPPEAPPSSKKPLRQGRLFPEAAQPQAPAAPEAQPAQPASPPLEPEPPKPKPPLEYTRPEIRTTPPIQEPRTFTLPTVIHSRDRSVMVRIPAGTYQVPKQPAFPLRVGENTQLEYKTLKEFLIDRTEVSVAQYKRFNPDYNEMVYTGGRECPECPAMAVDWLYAERYCRWVGKRLPTEEEWEAAARGRTDYKYPWGNQHQPGTANIHGKGDGFEGPAPVGAFPRGTGPTGTLDMIGNVWEWVSTRIVMAPLTGQTPPLQDNSPHLVKGGSWRSPAVMASISYRNLVDPKMINPTFGFRCAKSVDGE